jgi:hypothetical protein
MQWERLSYGNLPLEYADAQCKIAASGVGSGVVAWGSPEYVAGAQIGNAISNAIQQDQFFKNCMTLQGWKQVPKAKPAAQYTATPSQAAAVESLLVIGMVADTCGIAMSSDGRAALKQARQIATAEMRKNAKAKADENMTVPIAAMGKRAYCEKARGILVENQLI